jgi:hypothetical protein
MMRRQATAASISEEKIVLFLPNLPIRYIQLDIPGREIKPDEQIKNMLHKRKKFFISFYKPCPIFTSNSLHFSDDTS